MGRGEEGGEWGREDHRLFGMFRVIDLCLGEKYNVKANLRERGNNRRVLCLEAQMERNGDRT